MTIVGSSSQKKEIITSSFHIFALNKMRNLTLLLLSIALNNVLGDELNPPVSAGTTLGNLYRQARSEAYYAGRYGAEASSVTSGAIGIRGEPEHRDAAYYESRCITCDPNKSAESDRGYRTRNRYDYYDDEYMDGRRYRDQYDDYYERRKGSYDYDRGRRPPFDYDRFSSLTYDYHRTRPIHQDPERYDSYMRSEMGHPPTYSDREYSRYSMYNGRDRYYDNPMYDRNYDHFPDRGNGYDNLEQKYSNYGGRYDPYNSFKRPVDEPSMTRYDRYNRYHPMRYDPFERYEPSSEGSYYRPRYDDRYLTRDRPDIRGYLSSSAWGPGYERGVSSSWSYGGARDNWRGSSRDRDPGVYRPRDYFHDSTAAPGNSRGTSYLYDRPESSTKSDSTERDKPTSSPQSQDNKVYKD